MSTQPSDQQVNRTLQRLVREDPLAHPLPFAIRHAEVFGHEQATPEHLREIYGSAYRAFSPEYPRAPKSLVRIEPRGHGKSEVGSGVIPTWKVLRDPNTRVLVMMLNTDEAKGKLQKVKGYLEKLAPIYGHEVVEKNKTRLTLDRPGDFAEPTIRAAGIDTGVTGGRYEFILFDDIVDRDTQRTEHQRTKYWEKFQDHLKLQASDESVFFVLGTRKHRADLYSNLLGNAAWSQRDEQAIADWSIIANGEYDLVTIDERTYAETRYPATDAHLINQEYETIVAAEPYRWCDTLWPERWPLDDLLVDRHQGEGRELGSAVWKREMQNDPSALEGNVLKADFLHWVEGLQGRQAEYVRYAGLDLGIEKDAERAANNDTDYFALSIVAHHPRDNLSYIEDVYRTRGKTQGQALSWVSTHLEDYDNLQTCFVEANQGQSFFVQTGQSRGLPLEPTSSSGSKEDRIIDMAAAFEAGDVLFVDRTGSAGESAQWSDYVDELVAFPDAKHDDMLDSTEIALRAIDESNSGGSRFLFA